MIVVGTGCGPGLLTEEAISVLKTAEIVYGSKRAIEIVSPYLENSCEINFIEDYKKLKDLPPRSILLSTGDPMLAGLGNRGDRIIPGISSMQLAFSRLRLSLTNVSVVVAHGRDHLSANKQCIEELGRNKIVFLITDPGYSIISFVNLAKEKFSGLTIALCENLGYPEEVISKGTLESPPIQNSDLFVVVIWDKSN